MSGNPQNVVMGVLERKNVSLVCILGDTRKERLGKKRNKVRSSFISAKEGKLRTHREWKQNQLSRGPARNNERVESSLGFTTREHNGEKRYGEEG